LAWPESVGSIGVDFQRKAASSMRAANRAGFTLVELAIALAVGGVLVALALPVYHDWIADYQQMNFARDLAGSMNVARSEAIKRGLRVNLCKSADRKQCAAGGDWEQGFLVYVDADHDGQVDGRDAILRAEGPALPGITARGNKPLASYVSYTSMGTARLVSGALQMGTLTVCKRGRRAIDVVLANSGRARIQKGAALCP
jgi:type IV fimbrial biogenesis protein FimT